MSHRRKQTTRADARRTSDTASAWRTAKTRSFYSPRLIRRTHLFRSNSSYFPIPRVRFRSGQCNSR